MRPLLLASTAVLMTITLAMVFFYVPTEQVMGVVQRIFYYHVPLATGAFLGYTVIFVASIAYLIRASPRWDAVAHAGAEVGLVFTTLMLLSGVLWSKPVWGIWWDWSPRLTTSLILWFLYVAYLMLRAYAPRGVRGARYAAVLGILGFIDVPIIYLSTRLWRDVHPVQMVGPGAPEDSLAPAMKTTLYVAILAFTLLFSYLVAERYRLRSAEEEAERMQLAYGQR
ncbi:MAG: cytochrome C assembly protein [SAR202 cluster bacterium]|nr:cytochrome C assembly protein [SAR202 cluster bacterium]